MARFDLTAFDKWFRIRFEAWAPEAAVRGFEARVSPGRARRPHGAILDDFPCQGVVLTQIQLKIAFYLARVPDFYFFGYTSQLMNHCLGYN